MVMTLILLTTQLRARGKIIITWQILSHISSQPAFSWKLKAKSKLSPSDQTINVSCCFWYAVSGCILLSNNKEPSFSARTSNEMPNSGPINNDNKLKLNGFDYRSLTFKTLYIARCYMSSTTIIPLSVCIQCIQFHAPPSARVLGRHSFVVTTILSLDGAPFGDNFNFNFNNFSVHTPISRT